MKAIVLEAVDQKYSATLLKKRLWHSCFPVNRAKFLRTPLFTSHHSIQHDEASGETNAVFNQKWVFNTETIL